MRKYTLRWRTLIASRWQYMNCLWKNSFPQFDEFSTGFSTGLWKTFMSRASYETVCSLLTYLVPGSYVGFVVERPLHLLFSPWASTLRTVTPIGRSTWTNFGMSTVLIWSTPWSRFFLLAKTSMVLWLHWKTQWTVTKLSTGGLQNPPVPVILNSFTTPPPHHGNSLSHRNRNARPHCG